MNVASLALCKELYELSGWEDTSHSYSSQGPADYRGVVVMSTNDARSMKGWNGTYEAPAYDLGYLLRKLPLNGLGRFKLKNITARDTGNTVWMAHIDERKHELSLIADTPEDAAAKLAVELFKQAILVAGQGGESA